MDSTVLLVAIILMTGYGSWITGRYMGARERIQMLENLMKYGRPDDAPPGRTIKPETAESRVDVTAQMVEQEYAKATIATGVAELEALYVAEGRAVPSKKDLEAEVRDMLGRSGTPEAGIHV